MYNEPIKPVPKPTRKPNRRKKNPHKQLEKHKGRIIPHWKQRGSVVSREKTKAFESFGDTCFYCQNPNVQIHHVKHKGFGVGGRGVWRNLIALCLKHHTGEEGVHSTKYAHRDTELQEMREKQYGPHYYKDEYDLWKEGLIHKPERELLETFMEEQEQMVYQRKIIKEEYLDEKNLRSEGHDQENGGRG